MFYAGYACRIMFRAVNRAGEINERRTHRMKLFLSVLLVIGSFGTVVAAADTAGGADDTLGLLIGVLKDTADPAAQAELLKGMNAAMEGKKNVKMPAGW